MNRLRGLSPLRGFFLLLLTVALTAQADTVHLKNGKTLDGEVLRDDKDGVLLRVPYGEIKLKAEDVEFVERQTPTEYKITLGRKWLQKREYERAVKVLEEGFVADKASPDARRMLATAYEQQGAHFLKVRRLVEARGAYESLLKLDPEGKHFRHNAREALASIRKQEGDLESILNAARSYSKLKQWSQAIDAYSLALSYSPDVNAIVGVEVGECYVQRGMQYAAEGNLLNAAGDFEAAMRSDPAQAAKIERLYLSCALPTIFEALSRGDMRTARVDLERVLTYVPTSRSAMYVSGRMEEALRNLAGAAEHYARALRSRSISATPEYVAELRRQVEKDLNFEGDRIRIDTAFAELTGFAKSDDGPPKKLESENFAIIHYNEPLANELAGRAESERLRLTRDLRLRGWDGKAKIMIHRTQAEYTARTGLPEWTGAFARYSMEGGKAAGLEIHSWQTSPRLLTTILPHEIMHLLMYTNATNPMAIPHSLHEGFAVLAEPRFRQEHMLSFLRIRMKSQEFIPLAELLTMRSYPKDPEFLYAEGYALVLYLVSLRGLEATCALIQSIGNGSPAQDEILKLSGCASLDALETQWKDWLLNQK